MNIQNAFSAYGVESTDKQTSTSNLSAALEKLGANKSAGAKSTKKSDVSAFETEFTANAESLDSALASDIYTKNGESVTSENEDADTKTDAEKNEENIKSAANRISTDDMEKLINEGFDVFGMTTDELMAAVDRMKLQKEVFEAALENQIEEKIDTRTEIIEFAIKVLDSDPNAEKIAEKLIRADLPVTEENLKRMSRALEIAKNEKNVSSETAEYLIRNNLVPTLENINTARAAVSAHSHPEKKLSDTAWAELQGPISHLLFQAGLRQSKDIMTAAQDFIKKDIPLTAENLKAYSQITKIKLTDDEILTRAADSISVGQDPMSANLLSKTASQVRQIINNNNNVTDAGINYAVAKKAAETGDFNADKIELTLSDLHTAEEEVKTNQTVPRYLEEYTLSGAGNAAQIKARRQLEEVKAKMTYEAGYRLAKEGVRIDSVSMNKLIDNLRMLENRYYSDYFRQSGAAPGSYTQEDVDLLRDTSTKLKEIENMPATLIYDTINEYPDITVNGLHAAGTAKYGYDLNKYNNTLETVMTAPQSKYGDSIEKAFSNVDSLLKNAGIEVTESTRRATRILGYAAAEITRENVETISEYDNSLQTLLNRLRPEVTVKMIREGINPLNESLDSLNEKAQKIIDENNISSEISYSNFLVNLDKKSSLSSEERDAYLAIYRALHQISESRDPALGAVFNSGETPSLKNLLTAVRSGRVTGHEILINDTFNNVSKIYRDVDKIENKIRLGISNQNSVEAEAINNLTESVDNTIKELSEDSHYTAEDWVKNLSDIAANGSNATRFLEDFNILTNAENIEAAKNLLNNDTTLFRDWKRFKSIASGEKAVLPDFLSALTSDSEIQEAYASFAKETTEFKKEIQHDPSLTKLDVKALKKTDVGIKLMNRLSKRKFYQIPVDTGDDIININVTLINNGDESAPQKVFAEIPTETLGTISAEATLTENDLKCFISGASRVAIDTLKNSRLNLFAELAENKIHINSIFYGTEEVQNDLYQYKTDGAYKDTSEAENAPMGTEVLYRIARTLVTHVRQIDSAKENTY